MSETLTTPVLLPELLLCCPYCGWGGGLDWTVWRDSEIYCLYCRRLIRSTQPQPPQG